jgi:hypothetical protein
MAAFMKSYEGETYALMRIVVGFLFLWHGTQKLVGFPPLPEGIVVPAFITWIAGPIELFGGLLVMIGLFTRWAAFLCSGLMAFAYWMGHGTNALLPILNGGEPAALYCFVFLFIAARGAGRWSVEGTRGVAGPASAVVAFLLAAGPFVPPSAAAEKWPDIAEARAIAEEGFVYGLPIVMNYAVMYAYAVDASSPEFKAPFNQLKNEARVFTYRDTAVVTPNSDTPYSFSWLDLRAEPVVISVPAVDKDRYYAVMFVDGSTFTYGYIGSRATGNGPGDYLVAGPDWKGEAPPGIRKVFRSTTQFSMAGYRTQLFGPDDIENVKKVQAGYRVRPLSAFLGKPAPPAAPRVDFPKVDKELAKKNFFEYLDWSLQFAPPGPEEMEIRAKLARIGVGPGKSYDFAALPAEHKAEMLLGMKAGEERIDAYLAKQIKKVNGWGLSDLFGDRAFFAGDWLKRAAGAKAGIYGNASIEATYPMARTLADGTPLDGSKHAYTLTFPAGQLPPVNAFWSLTMYDGKTQLLIQNPIDRYLINSPMLPGLKKNTDGSLTLYIQHVSPGPDKESNWLPAPAGPIYLVMRLYWPKTEPPSVLPPGEGTWKPPAIALAR